MKPTIVTTGLDREVHAHLYYGQDVRKSLRLLPDNSVQTVCTSPPYWGLRDYGGEPGIWGGDAGCEHDWGDEITKTKGGSSQNKGLNNSEDYRESRDVEAQTLRQGQYCQKCGAWVGQLGLEPSPHEFVSHLVEVFNEIRRVLRPDGTIWVNLGDSYINTPVGKFNGGVFDGANRDFTGHTSAKVDKVKASGLKQKDMAGVPWRFAFAMQDAGWYLRSDIIWAKGSCMPESIRDRPTKAHEYIFLFAHPDSKGRYFYDRHAIREPHKDASLARYEYGLKMTKDERIIPGSLKERTHEGVGNSDRMGDHMNLAGRNKRSWWQVNPRPYPGAHFAVWPPDLAEPMIKAGSSEYGCCSNCRAPYKRTTEVAGKIRTRTGKTNPETREARMQTMSGGMNNDLSSTMQVHRTAGWEATCDCEGAEVIPCTVLDPFSGSATTGAVAMKHGRNYIGTDLQPDYLELAKARLEGRKAPKKKGAEDEAPDLIGDLFG